MSCGEQQPAERRASSPRRRASRPEPFLDGLDPLLAFGQRPADVELIDADPVAAARPSAAFFVSVISPPFDTE